MERERGSRYEAGLNRYQRSRQGEAEALPSRTTIWWVVWYGSKRWASSQADLSKPTRMMLARLTILVTSAWSILEPTYVHTSPIYPSLTIILLVPIHDNRWLSRAQTRNHHSPSVHSTIYSFNENWNTILIRRFPRSFGDDAQFSDILLVLLPHHCWSMHAEGSIKDWQQA